MTRRTPLPFGIRNAGGPAVPNDEAPVSVWVSEFPRDVAPTIGEATGVAMEHPAGAPSAEYGR